MYCKKKVYEATAAPQPVTKPLRTPLLFPLSESFVVTGCATLEFKCMRDFFLFIFFSFFVVTFMFCIILGVKVFLYNTNFPLDFSIQYEFFIRFFFIFGGFTELFGFFYKAFFYYFAVKCRLL